MSLSATDGCTSTLHTHHPAYTIAHTHEQPSGHSPVAPSPLPLIKSDGGVGKTSLLLTYTTGEYPEEYMPTVFETFMTERMVRTPHNPCSSSLTRTRPAVAPLPKCPTFNPLRPGPRPFSLVGFLRTLTSGCAPSSSALAPLATGGGEAGAHECVRCVYAGWCVCSVDVQPSAWHGARQECLAGCGARSHVCGRERHSRQLRMC